MGNFNGHTVLVTNCMKDCFDYNLYSTKNYLLGFRYKKNMKKLNDLGINYDFFTPVDIPEELEENKDSPMVKDLSSSKKDTAVKNKDSKAQKNDKIKEIKKPVPAKKEPVKEQKKVDPKKEKKSKAPEPVVNKKEQKQKEQKLKDAGVKPPVNFIQILEDDDSDSSADFDSDDYSKMLENESEVESGDESEDDSTDDKIEQGSSGDDGESDEFEITGSDDDDSEVDER